jgi:hypothetical protein
MNNIEHYSPDIQEIGLCNEEKPDTAADYCI